MPAKKTARLALRVSEDLKARVEAEAERRGQKLTTFVERALESALGPSSESSAPESVVKDGRRGPSRPASTRASQLGKGTFTPRPKGKK